MANKALFGSARSKESLGEGLVLNEAGGKAYALTPKQALAQYAATGCFNSTYYASAEEQVNQVSEWAGLVEAEFLAKTAVYAREKAFMKDMPAFLCAQLSQKNPALLRSVFHRVVNNGRMARNFVQVLRSGQAGRKSLGTVPKKLVQRWLAACTDEEVFRASVGNTPSLVDVVKMVHPKPGTASREALYGYLLGREHKAENLPEIVKQFEAFKGGERAVVPDVPFQMLTALNLGKAEWTAIARNAGWQMTRMNLNTFARHGVFEDPEMVERVANRLRDSESVKRSRVFPYQLFMAFKAAGKDVPHEIREALQDAMEIAIDSVPVVAGKVIVCPDVSGSMGSPVTGHRDGSTTSVRCIDVAALVAASILRKNPQAEILPFEHDVVSVELNGRDSVMTNARKLGSIGGGGTNCSAPIRWLNENQTRADMIVLVSDNQSWVDTRADATTETMNQWSIFRRSNPNARMVCIDIQPVATTQAADREDILNVGGFSDAVFQIIAAFAEARLGPDHWVGEIESISL